MFLNRSLYCWLLFFSMSWVCFSISGLISAGAVAAVFDSGAGPTVWVVDSSGAVSAARVKLAGLDAEQAFIGAGVLEGARIVALGVHKLSEGDKVRAVETLAGL